jgi:NTP pyrophosphatase (non-canonical NTP hydrolase)
MERISVMVYQIPEDRRAELFILVTAERKRQHAKFGHLCLADQFKFSAILGEEVGEICRAINQENDEQLFEECIQTLAVIFAFLEGDLHYGTEK